MKLFPQSAVIVLAFALLLVLHPLAANAQVSEVTLDNGLRLIVSESHDVPVVAIDVWVKAGTRRESASQPGVAHFLEHLLFKGTPTHPTEESIDGSIEELGGSFDAATSYDWAHFYTDIPSSGCADALGLLADVVQHSELTSDSIEQERPVILDEIDRSAADPAESLESTARSLFYTSDSAYGRTITGTADNVRAVTRDQLLAFYKTYYVPNNIRIVVSGNVNPADVQRIVTQDFGDWKRSDTLPDEGGSDTSSYAAQSTSTPSVVKRLIQADSSESHLVIVFPAPSVSNTPDAWDMDVLLTLLGQGSNNRLKSDLKVKQHLVTDITADFLTQKDPGILTVSASMPTANVDAVQSGILDQVFSLRTTPVTPDELNSAKLALKSSYLFDVDTDSGHADSLGFYDSIDSYEYDVDYLDHIDAVTSDDIQRIANKYLDPNTCTIVMQVPHADPVTVSNTAAASTILVSDETTQR